jgi:hypothetical protein
MATVLTGGGNREKNLIQMFMKLSIIVVWHYEKYARKVSTSNSTSAKRYKINYSQGKMTNELFCLFHPNLLILNSPVKLKPCVHVFHHVNYRYYDIFHNFFQNF